jgi:hypothetical protein
MKAPDNLTVTDISIKLDQAVRLLAVSVIAKKNSANKSLFSRGLVSAGMRSPIYWEQRLAQLASSLRNRP